MPDAALLATKRAARRDPGFGFAFSMKWTQG
jgi:hypothetical protein